jgi:hypothetical protein
MVDARPSPSADRFARRKSDQWYVSNGVRAVGPVKLDLIARGVSAGMVPCNAYVRHESWRVWCPLSDLVEVVATGSRPGASGGGADDTCSLNPQAVGDDSVGRTRLTTGVRTCPEGAPTLAATEPR